MKKEKAVLFAIFVCLLVLPWINPQIEPRYVSHPISEPHSQKISPHPRASRIGYNDNGFLQRDASLRATAGARTLLVILVEYTDETHTFTPAEVAMVAIDTLDEYYNETSFGLSRVTGNTTSWLQLGNQRSNYVSGTSFPSDPMFNLVRDAIDTADPYVNYDNYDDITIVHAGQGQELSRDWEDYWSCSWSGFTIYTDERSIHQASVSPEEGLSGYQANVGVIAHEYGHDLGLPDLYDYDGEDDFIGDWGLMGTGSWNGLFGLGESPAHMMGWSKMELGYVSGAQVVEVPVEINAIVDPLELATTGVHLLKIPVTSYEYFLVEVRQQLGYDTYIPDSGVLLTHINELIGSGHGIVKVIDARPESGTLIDAAFDVGSGERDTYMSAPYAFTMVVEGAIGNSYNISILRAFVSFDNLPDGATILGPDYNVKWTGIAAAPGINRYELFLDGYLEYVGLDTKFTLTGMTAGSHNVTLTMLLNGSGKRFTIKSQVNVVLDNQPPSWVNEPTNQFLLQGHVLGLQLEATDPSGIGAWLVNDTTNFIINSTGYLESLGALALGSYGLRISVVDLYGNTRSATISVVVYSQPAPPLILLVTITAVCVTAIVVTGAFLYKRYRT